MKRIIAVMIMLISMVGLSFSLSHAKVFNIAIMQDKPGVTKKFRPLVHYLRSKEITVRFVNTPTYESAAKMFSDGRADAMFSGSGVAGSMIIKEVAYPAVRPLSQDGTSTYWAVILAPKGSPKFTGEADYFSNKKVTFCGLASSGEIYFRSINGQSTAKTMKKAASHGIAIRSVAKGDADIAVVKNRVWDSMKGKYPNIEIIGTDTGENPNGTLIYSNKVDSAFADKVTSALLGLMQDSSPEAQKVRDELKIMGYIKTTDKDFSHTLPLLKKAGIDKSFNFKF